MIEKLTQIRTITESIIGFVKCSMLAATFMGTYYFLNYTIAEGLPFPLNITILPTFLLVIGTSSIAITALMIIYMSMAVLVHTDPCDVNYPIMINTNRRGVFRPCLRVVLCNWFLIYGVPVVIWLILLFQRFVSDSGSIGILGGGYLIWGLLYGVAKVQAEGHAKIRNRSLWNQIKMLDRSDCRCALRIAMTTYMVSFLGLLSSVFFLWALSAKGLLKNDQEFIFASVVFMTLNFGVLAVKIKPNASAIINESVGDKIVLNTDAFKGKLFETYAIIIFGFMFVLTLLPNVASYIGEIPLRLLNIGGGVKRSFTVSKEVAKSLPEDIIEGYEADGKTCVLKNLAISLDLGQIIYVRTTNSRPTFVHCISRVGLQDIIVQK